MQKSSPVPDPMQDPAESSPAAAKEKPMPLAGPRKLIRPVLSGQARYPLRRDSQNPGGRAIPADAPGSDQDSHAETFYLQKQLQAQTLMVIVLENGERIEGYLEWYDSHAIKVRHGARTMIYKSCIKYMYKAGEAGRHI